MTMFLEGLAARAPCGQNARRISADDCAACENGRSLVPSTASDVASSSHVTIAANLGRCVAVGAAISALIVVLAGCGDGSVAPQTTTRSSASMATQQPNTANSAASFGQQAAAAGNAHGSTYNAIIYATNAHNSRIGEPTEGSGSRMTETQAINTRFSQVITLPPTMKAIHFPSPFQAGPQGVSGSAVAHELAQVDIALTLALNTHSATNHYSKNIGVHTTMNALVASTQALLVTLW